jgi:hypothetical protein
MRTGFGTRSFIAPLPASTAAPTSAPNSTVPARTRPLHRNVRRSKGQACEERAAAAEAFKRQQISKTEGVYKSRGYSNEVSLGVRFSSALTLSRKPQILLFG